jgi:uncharacterized protein
MDLKSTLQSDLKDAMRQGEETRKSTLRMALSAFKLAEIDKGKALDEVESLAIIQKEIKSRREAIADAERANRPELITQAEQEIKVLQVYMPAAFSEEELEALVKAAIAESGAKSMQDMRKVMTILLPKLQARATGDQASKIVRKLLQ